MKRTIKNILMILIILILVFLTYFTLGYLKENKTLNNVLTEFKTNVILMNEENETSTETIDENGNITTTIYEQAGEGTDSTGEDPDGFVSSEDEILYTTSEEQVSDTDLSATTGMSDDKNAEKSLALGLNKIEGISYIYYIVFALEGLLFSKVIAYLAFSKFNKLSFKEAIPNFKRFMGFALYTILIFIVYAFCIYYFI